MRLDSAETRREFAEAFRQESSLEEHRSNVARSLLMQVFREPNLKVAEADDLLDVLEIDGIRPIATGLMMSIGDQTEPRMEWMIKRYADHKDLPPLVRAVTSMWANTAHRAAATWITEMPTNSPIRDSAIRGFVKSIARTEPESATDWANIISDPTLRSKALQEAERVAKRWQKSRSSNE